MSVKIHSIGSIRGPLRQSILHEPKKYLFRTPYRKKFTYVEQDELKSRCPEVIIYGADYARVETWFFANLINPMLCHLINDPTEKIYLRITCGMIYANNKWTIEQKSQMFTEYLNFYKVWKKENNANYFDYLFDANLMPF